MFYLSEYLETHRDEYYDGLLSISSENNWHGWIEFFLQAIVIQSDTNISKAKEILSLYDNLKDKFIDVTHSQYAVPALDTFFKIPIINTVEFYKLSGIPNRMTANNLLRKLVDSQSIILLKQGQGRQPSVYAMPNLINIAEGRKVLWFCVSWNIHNLNCVKKNANCFTQISLRLVGFTLIALMLVVFI